MTKMLSEIKEQPDVLEKLKAHNQDTLRVLTGELKAKNIKRAVCCARNILSRMHLRTVFACNQMWNRKRPGNAVMRYGLRK